MPKHSIRILDAAEQDIVSIVEYIATDNLTAALQLAEDIERQILSLEDFPQAGAVPKNRRLARKGYRMLVVGDHLVFYCVIDKNIVEIRRVLSGKRKYAFLL